MFLKKKFPQVAYMWCRTLSMDGAARLLTKMDLVQMVLNYACDIHEYEFALEMCRLTGSSTDDVHLKIAMDLEDEEKVCKCYLFNLFLLTVIFIIIFNFQTKCVSSTKRKPSFFSQTSQRRPY